MIKTQFRILQVELSEELGSDGFVKRVRAKDCVTSAFPGRFNVETIAIFTALPIVERARNEIFEDFDSTIAISVVLC